MYDSQRTNGEHTPYWYEALSSAAEKAVSDGTSDWPERSLDLVVVGGGMSGLSVAYHAAKRGQSVVATSAAAWEVARPAARPRICRRRSGLAQALNAWELASYVTRASPTSTPVRRLPK